MQPSAITGPEPASWPGFGRGYRAAKALIRVLFPPAFRLLYHWRVTGREHLQGLGAAVTLCNHVHTLDCVMMALAMPHKELLFLSLPDNLHKPLVGPIVRGMGGVAVPQSTAEYRAFYRRLQPELAAGRFLQIYPEGWLEPGCPTLRPFHPGAFQMAVRFGVPVVPCVLRPYARPQGRPGLELCILEPIAPDARLSRRAAARQLEAQARAAMLDALGLPPEA